MKESSNETSIKGLVLIKVPIELNNKVIEENNIKEILKLTKRELNLDNISEENIELSLIEGF
ncbi:hypothetical protein [Clostridium hydrogeniformans]|uniref:hypothetical protein n=1 Tax=Clostridium hydrogeniformans TaxID=349933 RepID=UPI00047F62D7|nr:hypothetical protein [Clostridium hydrogeniformans]